MSKGEYIAVILLGVIGIVAVIVSQLSFEASYHGEPSCHGHRLGYWVDMYEGVTGVRVF